MSGSCGLVALGDSITRGGGNMALGVYPRSWAHWLADALELPFTGLAEDGATASDVADGQLARLGDRYDVGCVYVGVNDVRSVDWDEAAYARDLERALATLAARCTRLAVLTIPLDLGRPRAGAKVGDANRVIRRVAAGSGAAVVALDDLRGRRFVLPDAVHPHAVGQLEIADRAARALDAPRMPSTLTERDRGARAELRWGRAYARMWMADVLRRVREGGLKSLKM